MEVNKIIQGDCLEVLKTLPGESIDCCVTSPPYYGLRDYGTAKWEGGDLNCSHEQAKVKTRFDYPISEKQNSSKGTDVPIYKAKCECGAYRVDGQIGLEETPEMFVAKMVEVFTEVKRVLKKDGTLWLNLGDSYNGSGKGGNPEGSAWSGFVGNKDREKSAQQKKTEIAGLKPKDLIGIPWMVAFALRSSGWYLRQDIIWHKPNPMPESVTDRCTKSHEYIFLLSKSQRYYYDAEAIKEKAKPYLVPKNIKPVYLDEARYKIPGQSVQSILKTTGRAANAAAFDESANKRSVWTVTTKPFSEAHFATFPEDLIVDCIKAGCPENVCNKCGKSREKIIESERLRRDQLDKSDSRYRPNRYNGAYESINGKGDAGYTRTEITGLTDCGCNEGFSPGIVLDPFSGAGTTALVARKLYRNYIGIELNQQYIDIAEKRLQKELGMFI